MSLIVLSGREALCRLYMRDSLGQLATKLELGRFAVSHGCQHRRKGTRPWESSLLLTYCDKALDVLVGSSPFLWVLQVKKKADERTRTDDLLQLRVIGQALQGFAQVCKCRIFRGVFLSPGCCVLHRIAFPVVSEWYPGRATVTG